MGTVNLMGLIRLINLALESRISPLAENTDDCDIFAEQLGLPPGGI